MPQGRYKQKEILKGCKLHLMDEDRFSLSAEYFITGFFISNTPVKHS